MDNRSHKFFQILILLICIYGFLLSISLLSDGLKLLGKGFVTNLISITSNPFLGLIIGLFTTAIVQSSSATTSITVGLVAAGTLSITNAIPIIMGANIGTTVTNTLVSLGQVTRKNEFQRAFPSAVIHDFFNILTVLVVFPLELKFHILRVFSEFLTKIFSGIGGTYISSPLKYIITPISSQLIQILGNRSFVIVIMATILLFASLKFLVDAMRAITTSKLELVIDRYLFGNAVQSFLVGLITTAIIQSSSVTTSLIIPLVGAGILSIYKILPYTIGANIGTTVTAILASLAIGNPLGIQIAFAHFGFNLIGACIWYPARIVPIKLALFFGKIASKNRFLAILYIIVVFYLVPIIIFIITKIK
ncbi:MAG: Na/Pi symporter [candidate division WOR-3 bacterium]|nr:Na/Pi symporter [candidate division WOR-3 bacterium]